MLNEFASYTSNLDATKNDANHKARERAYCPNGTDIGRPVAGSLPIPPPSSSWNYPYLSNLYNYYNPNSYELGNVPQYDNQKCSSQYVRNYNEHSSRFHSTSVLQCCDPRCQLIAKHAKYPYHPANTKITQHPNKRTKNYYGSIVDLPKPDASVTGLAPSMEHPKYTPCVPYPTLRNDLNGKYSNQPGEYCSPFANTLKRGTDSGFNEYYTDIGNPSYWNKPNTSIWNRNTSYYAPTFEDKNSQKIDQANFQNGGSRGILFNRLLEHRDPYETGYPPNYYYGPKNDLNPNINYNQPNVPCEPVLNNARVPLQANSYQPPAAYNIHYPPAQTVPQYYKENTPKRVPDTATQETRILDKNPNLDVREFLSTWEDDVDDEKVVEPANESPVIVLDCTNLEGDVLAKVKEKLNGNAIGNDDTAILKIVDVSNGGSAAVLSPHTSVIQENAVQSKEVLDKAALESSHMNSDGYMTWYSNGKKKEDFSYDLVEMTERLVNTVGKLLSDPEKKGKPTCSSIKEPAPAQLQDSHARLLPRPLPAPAVLPNNWNPNPDIRKNMNIPPAAGSGCLGNVSTASNVSYNNYTSELDRSQQPLSEKNVSCTFNLRKTSNDLKFSVNYSTQQNDYNVNKGPDMSAKFKPPEFTQPYYEYHKNPPANPPINASNYKSYSAYSSYYENTGCNYDQTKLCNASSYSAGIKDNSMNYVDHIEKHAVNDTDITLVKADLEKSLNEISHTFKSNASNVEKNCQYFDSNSLNSTGVAPKSDESFKCNERAKVIETQTYNGVIHKTGICNSPVQKMDSIAFNDNLLSMPSLSPPPNSSSATTQPVISSSSAPKNNEQPLCGINLTLTDVYENEDTIFDTSQAAENNTFIPFCSGSQTSNDQTYQPLNLAVSRDTKSQDLCLKDQQKPPECDETDKVVEGKTNCKADDGYYSVENEADEVSGNNSKKSSNGPVSVAYHPCIVSHEQPKPIDIQGKNHSASETISDAASPYRKQQNHVASDQPLIGEHSNSNIIGPDDTMKPVIESTKGSIEILQDTAILNELDKFDRIQSENSCKPVLLSEGNTDQNDSRGHHNSDLADHLDDECDASSLNNSSNSDEIANAPTPHLETESSNFANIEEPDEVAKVENVGNESMQMEIYEQEDTVLNLKMQPDTPICPVPCESVIKENENFIHHTIKEKVSLLSPGNNQCESAMDCVKKVPEALNSEILINEKPSPKSVVVDHDMNYIEKDVNCTPRSDNSVEEKVRNDQLKRKSIDIPISNTNLPMKKRRGQEYLTEQVTSLEPSTLITSVEDSVRDSYHSPVVSTNHYEENEEISDIPRKNKKKRKKDKSKNNLKHKKYSKFKRHTSSKEQTKYQKKNHLCNENESQNSIVSEVIKDGNTVSSSSSSPIYNHDDMFNIPSVAPTPQFDLIQDFEPQKEQFGEEPNCNMSNNICKSDFINSSIDLHMMKAPSPNCVLQDDAFMNEKPSSKAPSPYYDYNYGGVSPSSVAPSPNYDIIEGVLFDDTDSSRNNEDVDCKNKSNLELKSVSKHVEPQESVHNFNRSTKYSITENEYESDYETDRCYFKRKRVGQIKRLVKKSKNLLKYNHHEHRNNTRNNSKFSVNVFRHFDYAVDDERCIRSEDDEYEPRPNHIRHAFKPKSRANCTKVKDNGKYVRKCHFKYNQRDKKKIVDSTCDLYFNKKKSTYISSPEYQLPAHVSSQCDKIISKFQMIEATRSDLFIPDSTMKNASSFEEDKLECRRPRVISRDGRNGELLSDIEDNMASSPAHTENIHSPVNSPHTENVRSLISVMESDTETSDFQDCTSKPDSNHLLNNKDTKSGIDSIVDKESDVTEHHSSSEANIEIEKTDLIEDIRHTNHLNESQPSNNYSHPLSVNSTNEEILPESSTGTNENSSSEKLSSISNDHESTDQLNLGFNEQSAHSSNTNQSDIVKESHHSLDQLEESFSKEVNDGTNINLTNQFIPNQVEKDPSNIHCPDQSVIHFTESYTNSSKNRANTSANLPDIPSKDISCTELNDSCPDIKNGENISPSNITHVTRIESSDPNDDCIPQEVLHANPHQLSDNGDSDEEPSKTLPVSEQSLPDIGHSSHGSVCSNVNDGNNNSDVDITDQNESNIPPEIEEDEFVNEKNMSPIYEKADSSDCSSNLPPNSHESAASPDSEAKTSLDEENSVEKDSSNLLSCCKSAENEYQHSTEEPDELGNISSNQKDDTSHENDSGSFLDNARRNNIIDTNLGASQISQTIHSVDSVIQHNICPSPSEDHAVLEEDLDKDPSPTEPLSIGNEKHVDENISNESEIFASAIHSSEPIDETGELDASIEGSQISIDTSLMEENINPSDSPEPADDFNAVPESGASIILNSPSPVGYLDDGIEETGDTDDTNIDACQTLSPSSIEDGDQDVNRSSDLESYSEEPIMDPFSDNLEIPDCNDNSICKVAEDYQNSLDDPMNSDSDHQAAEDHCVYSDKVLFTTTNLNSPCNTDQDESLLTSCNELTDIAMETGLCDTNNYIDSEVPTLRFLAIKALSRATINNNLLEVRETPERTEIIIHSDEPCDPADFEDGDSSNLIMTDTFDDDTHVSPNFEALKEMTFDYSTLPESTSNGYEEKNDEDLPCQCLIISSEESILCLRCSLNSSVDASQFHEMDESCEVSVSSLPDDTPTSFDCVEGDCIEQSFIDQEIDFATTSPVTTYASVDSSPCPPVVESVEESILKEKTQIKVQLPWHRIFNLGGETNDGDNVESSGVCRQRVLELGPAQIEVRMLSDDCSWWKNSSSSGNSSPVVKVKRLVLQRAAAEAAAAEFEAEESNATAQAEEQELVVPASEVEPKKGAPRRSRKNVKDGERILDEILGVPKMVIRKTSCRQYKSYLRTHRILQPLVRLKKNKWLDELALKYQQGNEPLRIIAADIEPKLAEQDAVAIEVGEEIVAGVDEEAEVDQEINQEFSEEASADAGTNEEIAARITEQDEGSQQVDQEICEEATTEVGTSEETAAGDSEPIEGRLEPAEVAAIDIVAGAEEVEMGQEFDEAATLEIETKNGVYEPVISGCENKLMPVDLPVLYSDPEFEVEVHNTQTDMDDGEDVPAQELTLSDDSVANQEKELAQNTIEELPEYCSSTNHLLDVRTHLSLRSERHHCMLCHLSYNCVEAYRLHLRSRFHRHLELMQRGTVHALYRRFTGRPCPSLRPLSAKERKIMKWKPRNADVNHFYHYKAPLQIALQGMILRILQRWPASQVDE